MLKRCFPVQGCIRLSVLLVFIFSFISTTYTQDDVEVGRQIIQDLYNNLSSQISSNSSSVSNPVDLIFVLDRSANVKSSEWQLLLRFVQNFLEHFTIDANNTRVAVISYSTTASVDIDGIGSGDYNKCSFAARLQNRMAKKIPSGYSATHEAILRAKDVALMSRANAKKIAIVIICGKSNVGPPPIRASIQLRSLTWGQGWNLSSEGPQLQVFAFGIKDAYIPEVRSIASPLPNHTFYIPTFQAFAELAKSLHDDNQSESWKVLTDAMSCHGICHVFAYCACGTRSGRYLCICRDGYQGDGMLCTACPRGTYKSKISPSRCVTCPSNSTTLIEGATDVTQCVCQPSLHQNAIGQSCHMRYCNKLPDIHNGHKFHVSGRVVDQLTDTGITCTNLPDTSCHFQCDIGYHLNGHPGLVCNSNGTWEGDVPSCHIVDCGNLSIHQQDPEHATVVYVNQTTTYGSVVRVECHNGWRTFGDSERICSHNGVWSGTRTWCVENHCPALVLSPGLIITPTSCGLEVQIAGAVCMYLCSAGYDFVGPQQVVCTEQGTWDNSTPPVCVDTESPSITCPANVTTHVTSANFAVIQPKSYPPLVTDNSGEFIITGIGVEDSDSPRLTVGLHQIQYIVRDKAGNEASCVQEITVVDVTVQLVTCPESDVTINMTSHLQETFWPEVIFMDSNNNNMTVAHRCVPTNSSILPAGVYTVTCVPETHSYMTTHCQFRAILKQPECAIPPPPAHGSVSCSPTPTSLLTCIPHCNDNFHFHRLPQQEYICDLSGKWTLRTDGHFWPDCSRKYLTNKAGLSGKVKYFYNSGRCEDISAEIVVTFTEFLENQTREMCRSESCHIEIVRVSCGSESKKKRRSAEEKPENMQHEHELYTSISWMNLSLESRTETVSAETSQDKSLAATGSHLLKQTTRLVQSDRNMKEFISHHSLFYEKNNLETSDNITSGQQQSHNMTSGQQPNHNITSGQQPNHNMTSEQQPNHNMTSEQQPNHNMTSEQQPNHNMTSEQQQSHNITSGQQPNHNITSEQQHRSGNLNENNNLAMIKNQEKDITINNEEIEKQKRDVADTITRELYQINQVNVKSLIKSPEMLEYHDKTSTRSDVRIKKTAKCINCLDNLQVSRSDVRIKKTAECINCLDNPQVSRSDIYSSSIIPHLHKPNLLLDPSLHDRDMTAGWEVTQSYRLEHVLPKRSIEGVTPDLGHLDVFDDSQVVNRQTDVLPSIDDFLTNVEPPETSDDVRQTDVLPSIDNFLTNVEPPETSDDVRQTDVLPSIDDFLTNVEPPETSDDVRQTDVLPSIDEFLTNVEPPETSEEIQDPDELTIGFMISKKVINNTVDIVLQSELLLSMLNMYVSLNQSLELQNIFLGGINLTSLNVTSNGSNTLFPYQHELQYPELDTCDFGYVTLLDNTTSTQICVACPAGTHYDLNSDQCFTCPLSHFQPDEAQPQCLPCPDDMTTQHTGAYNETMCSAMCNPGQYSSTGLNPCQLCPLHSYQPFVSAAACLPCPGGRKTLTTGATHATYCLDVCVAGTYSETGLVPCVSCPVGSYQPYDGAIECFLCQDNMTTDTEQATNVSECFVWDACFSRNISCLNGGQCLVKNNLATCLCVSGFSGVSCEINVPDCFISACQNNGTCVDDINSFTCVCWPGFTGRKCEVNIDDCLSSPCSNGSSCLDLVNSYKCYCPSDYTGIHCETRVQQLCNENICVHGTCEERNSIVSCVCNQGFAGSTCNITYDLCSSHPCVHAGTCVSTSGQFECHCLPGFTEITADFDLVFNLDSPDGQYVVLPSEFVPSLLNFSVCAWLRPQSLSAFATIVAFTLPLSTLTFPGNDSYVYGKSKEFDIIFRIKHLNKLIVDIFDATISTNVTIPFYVWSHLCVTWSCTSGHWQVMVNGSLSADGTLDHRWSSIPAHVQIVLGQNNPYYAEAATLWQVYAGEITQFNIFSHILSLDNVRALANEITCNKTTYGDVISWTDVSLYTKADLVKRETSHCLDINECWFPSQFSCGNNRECVDLVGAYDCSVCMYGYTGSHCQNPDDECVLDNCQRGNCTDGPEPYDYQCICPSGYTGLQCEVMINFCLSTPCQNGGTCLPRPNSFSCVCPLQHMGPHCERPNYACFHNPCQNQGICREKEEDTFECSCTEHFTGRICERSRHWCEYNVCHNGGVCQNLSASIQNNVISNSIDDNFCECQDGWMGRQCEVRMIFSCDLTPCVNGGSCLPLIDSSNQGYRCQCLDIPNETQDENCEYLNPCDLAPCTNNTLCVLFSNYTFQCLCAGGHPCDSWSHDQSVSTDSYQNQTTEQIIKAATDPGLISKWVGALTAGLAIFAFLAAIFTFCILWRRKCARSYGCALNNTLNYSKGSLSNPGFQTEELQLEESIYAEHGDGYAVPQDDSTLEDLTSTNDNVRSVSLHSNITRSYIPVTSSSLAFMSSKLLGDEDTDKPLFLHDYFEPTLLVSHDINMVLIRDSNINEPLPTTDMTNSEPDTDNSISEPLLTSGITNLGFDQSQL